MSTTIDSVVLDSDMVWVDEFSHSEVNSSVTETVGGSVVIQDFGRVPESGKAITLESVENVGYQTKSTVKALVALASTPGNTYSLVMDNGGDVVTKAVRFRHEDPPSVSFKPFVEVDGIIPDTMYYKGTIKLMIMP